MLDASQIITVHIIKNKGCIFYKLFTHRHLVDLRLAAHRPGPAISAHHTALSHADGQCPTATIGAVGGGPEATI